MMFFVFIVFIWNQPTIQFVDKTSAVMFCALESLAVSTTSVLFVVNAELLSTVWFFTFL